MRILLVVDNWLPQVSGFTRTFSAVIRHLEHGGDVVEVVHPAQYPGIPCPTYPEIRLAYWSSDNVERRIEAFVPEAIHIAIEGPLGLAARRYCVKQGLPFTTSFTTNWPAYLRLRLPVSPRITYTYLRWFHAPAARCLVASPSLHGALAERGFRRLAYWGRGVDTELFKPRDKHFLRDERPIWLFVGRVAVEKNIRSFLDLDLPGTKYVVGDGPRRERLMRAYPAVRFTGVRSGFELARYYAAADVLVFPSLTDTFGLVMLEALASGVPVAAFPVPGPLDVIGDTGTGILDPDLGRAARLALTLSPDACRRYALGFSWAESARQFRQALAPF